MSLETSLLTGIPRSGTTLCCKLLNQRTDTIALHEPIDPASISSELDAAKSALQVKDVIIRIRRSIVEGKPFPNGDGKGLDVENPVGEKVEKGLRQVVSKRGILTLSPMNKPFLLTVKQNAMFSALLPYLEQHFKVVCIVRNPVDVMLSWMTVDLPVNRGRLPAGEKFSATLRKSLKHPDIFTRQLYIYQWFIRNFVSSHSTIIKFEDVLKSSGDLLDEALGLNKIVRQPLEKQSREFDEQVVTKLADNVNKLINIDCAGLYSSEEIYQTLESHGVVS